MGESVVTLRSADETGTMYVTRHRGLEDRRRFVENLGWLLSQTREGIEGCTLTDTDEVIIRYKGGVTDKVNVECDSYMAIIRDVSRAI